MKAILTRYHGPVNLRPARYSATDGDGLIVYVTAGDGRLSSDQLHEQALRKLCAKRDWTGSLVRGGFMRGGHALGYVWVWRQERLQIGSEVVI